MDRIPRSLMLLVLVVIVLPLAFMFLFKRVHPMEIGIKRVLVGGVGVIDRDYPAGFHLGITGVHKWDFLPRGTHFIHFVEERGRETDTTMWEATLQIRTVDQNVTDIDVSVAYRIKQDEAYKIVEDGYRTEYRRRAMETVTDVLRAQLAQLKSEDLQDTDTRLAMARAIVPLLNEELAPIHLEVQTTSEKEPPAVLIRRVAFQSEYEQKLQEKQYLQQKANLDRALSLVAVEEQVTNSIERQIGAAEARLTSEWDKKFQVEESRYEVLIAEIRAAARVYESQTKAAADADAVKLEAEGQLALDQARALRDRLRNEALSSRGGKIYLGLLAAGNLAVPSVTLNSNDPRVPLVLDLDELTGVLVGSQ
jgi:flotillin